MTTLNEALSTIKVGEQTLLDVAIGTDGRRNISLASRKLLDEGDPKVPTRAESPRKAHVFHSAEALRDYLVMFHGDMKTADPAGAPRLTIIFADVADETVYAVLGEHESEGVEIVTMKPQVHPLWYVQTKPFDIELDLTVGADQEGAVNVSVSAGTVLEAKVKAFEVMCETIREGLKGTGAVVCFGKPQHKPWDYVPEAK